MFNAIQRTLIVAVTGLSFTTVGHSQTYTYAATNAKNYAVAHYNTSYGTGSTQNPFPNVTEVGGNCTNFGNQAISSGLLRKTTPSTLNSAIVKSKYFSSTTRPEWFFQCNTINPSCQSSAWRGAQSMLVFSRDLANAKALRMNFVTKTALLDGKLTPLDHTIVKVGDIIFADFDFFTTTLRSADHTMIVTEVRPVSWYDLTLNSKYNSIRLTYQTTNKTDQGLGDIRSAYTSWLGSAEPAFYVYRPSGYYK